MLGAAKCRGAGPYIILEARNTQSEARWVRCRVERGKLFLDCDFCLPALLLEFYRHLVSRPPHYNSLPTSSDAVPRIFRQDSAQASHTFFMVSFFLSIAGLPCHHKRTRQRECIQAQKVFIFIELGRKTEMERERERDRETKRQRRRKRELADELVPRSITTCTMKYIRSTRENCMAVREHG